MHRMAHDAAHLLWTCRESGTVIDALPAALRPGDTAAAHAIQAALPAVADRPVVGWKIAATSAAGQAHIQVDGPLPGRILDAFVQPTGATFSLFGNRMRVVVWSSPSSPSAWAPPCHRARPLARRARCRQPSSRSTPSSKCPIRASRTLPGPARPN